MSENPIEGRPQGAFSNLRRRVIPDLHHLRPANDPVPTDHVPAAVHPAARRLRLRTHARDQELRRAVTWYREHGEPVDVVIPSYRDAERVATLLRSIRKTVRSGMARVIVADDCSGTEHLAALQESRGSTS